MRNVTRDDFETYILNGSKSTGQSIKIDFQLINRKDIRTTESPNHFIPTIFFMCYVCVFGVSLYEPSKYFELENIESIFGSTFHQCMFRYANDAMELKPYHVCPSEMQTAFRSDQEIGVYMPLHEVNVKQKKKSKNETILP